MIHDHPDYDDPWSRSEFEQLRRFLASRGADDAVFRMAHVSRSAAGDIDANAVMVMTYGGPPFHESQSANVRWATPSGPAEIRTDIGQAQLLLAFAFDRAEHLSWLTRLSADSDAAVAAMALGLPESTLETRVAASVPGSHVAPDTTGRWCWFEVEQRGEVTIHAEAAYPVPLLQMIAAVRLRQESDLAGRMAAFIVPVADMDGI